MFRLMMIAFGNLRCYNSTLIIFRSVSGFLFSRKRRKSVENAVRDNERPLKTRTRFISLSEQQLVKYLSLADAAE